MCQDRNLDFSSYFLNIDGNLTNFDSLSVELDNCKHKFSVIGLAEKQKQMLTNVMGIFTNSLAILHVTKVKSRVKLKVVVLRYISTIHLILLLMNDYRHIILKI